MDNLLVTLPARVNPYENIGIFKFLRKQKISASTNLDRFLVKFLLVNVRIVFWDNDGSAFLSHFFALGRDFVVERSLCVRDHVLASLALFRI